MESTCSPDKLPDVPPVPIKTYQWEDLRRARETGGYPWTHLQKPSLLGEITANDILRESTPQRSMSRDRSRTRSPIGVTIDPLPRIMSKEGSRSRTRSPDEQRILLLDASPGSCRKLGEEGEPVAGIHVPNFSKEVSLESEDDQIDKAIDRYIKSESVGDKSEAEHLQVMTDKSKSVSPKGILKRRLPERSEDNRLSTASSASGSKCCHPIVEKIKYIADKTLHKHDKEQNSKDPSIKKNKGNNEQEILHLKSSPRVERKKFAFLKMGESDEVSKTQSTEPSPITRKRKEHIYEDIEQSGYKRFLQFASDALNLDNNISANQESDLKDQPDETLENANDESPTGSASEKKSNASQDPSLQVDEDADELRAEEHIMESLHQHPEYVHEEAIILDIEEDNDDPVLVNGSGKTVKEDQDSPNITIMEITDEVTSTPEPGSFPEETVMDVSPADEEVGEKIWSAPNSDHEYELIGKPPEDVPTTPQITTTYHDTIETAEDGDSSITSLDRKYLHHSSDDEGTSEPQVGEVEDEGLSAEELQKTIEDRYFLNTPSTTASRTECDISTSQVESSALENLPLKRDSRVKSGENGDGNKIQQSIRAQTVKLKSQAGKLRTKLQSIKNNRFPKSDKPRFHFPDRPKFHMPDRPKFNFSDKTRFNLPDRKKFTLPDRPKFKKMNISLPDRKKFTLPDRPKFPDMSRFKIPEKAKINFSSLGRAKKDSCQDDIQNLEMDSTSESKTQGVIFESTTFPRILSRSKKQKVELASSDPALHRPGTPPPTFSFVTSTFPKSVESQNQRWDDTEIDEPRSYGQHALQYDADVELNDYNHVDRNEEEEIRQIHDKIRSNMQSSDNNMSLPNISANESPYTHVDEINTDEFFIRPKGISRENIEVRKYLSDEIREAFKAPANALVQMDTTEIVQKEESACGSRPHLNGYGDMTTDFIEEIRRTTETYIESDDGYYTFPPVRPSRAKKTKKQAEQPMEYIEHSTYIVQNHEEDDPSLEDYNGDIGQNQVLGSRSRSLAEDVGQEAVPIPSAPMRRKRSQGTLRSAQGSLNDFYQRSNSNIVRQWNEQKDDHEDIIVYRTEHEYTVPESTRDEEHGMGSPVPPRRSRNRSRDSRTTSLGDDDRTSHGAESLTLDPHNPAAELEDYPDIKRESPGYATVDKCPPPRNTSRSKSRTPPVRPRKSHSSDRKYFTVDRVPHVTSVDAFFNGMPPRPPRKKSSTSLMTLDSLRRASSGDVTQYVEIDDNEDEYHRKLQCGEVINKMKDRPLPPPPRPPRSERKNRGSRKGKRDSDPYNDITTPIAVEEDIPQSVLDSQEVIEMEVSTQTDPLPDDIDFEIGIEDCLDDNINTHSISSSLKDIIDGDVFYSKNDDRTIEACHLDTSRPTSRTSRGATDLKIRELTKSPTGRVSPTVILVERRVSSPTRINNRDEIVTEASLTVQHIDVDESKIPDVPPLPQSNANWQNKETVNKSSSENKVLDRRSDNRVPEVQLDSLVTQRLQVTDLDVGRLNVAELQAGKISVSEIEGLTLQVSELDSKSGHITVSGVQLAPEIIEEIVRKFAEITARTSNSIPVSREEETQTEADKESIVDTSPLDHRHDNGLEQDNKELTHTPPPSSISSEPPQRPPPPDLSPLLLSYLQELSVPPASFYHLRSPRERPFTDYYETHPPAPPPPPARRAKRKTQMLRDSSSDDDQGRGTLQTARRGTSRGHEPTLTELGAQIWRVCHTSVTRTVRHLFTSLMSYVSGCEDKKDVQMAVVIFLVLIAGLIMFGLSDGRTVHHHHWEFFNPPDGK